MNNVKAVKEQIPKKTYEVEKGLLTKWTFWAVVVRIFIYPLALGLICLGGYVIYDDGNIFIGIAVIAVATTFLFTDIKIMFGKKRSTTKAKM